MDNYGFVLSLYRYFCPCEANFRFIHHFNEVVLVAVSPHGAGRSFLVLFEGKSLRNLLFRQQNEQFLLRIHHLFLLDTWSNPRFL